MKKYLMTPGPCPVPPEVRLALARPVIHHRTEEYHAVHAAVVDGLRKILKTEKNDVFLFASTGTGAMESAVANTLSAGDKAIVVRGGKFSERWGELCRAYGAIFIPLDLEWGKSVDPGLIEKQLTENPDVRVVFTTLCETSTGAKTDIEAIGKIVAGTGAILVVDAVTGLGVSEMETDAWGLDVVVCGGQKAFMVPTGLAFVCVSEKAWERVDLAKSPRYYFDYRKAKKAADKNETPWSAPASLIIALKESIDRILGEGVENVIARHAALSGALRAGVAALGLEILAKYPSDGVTAIVPPDGVSADDLRETMRDKYGVTVAGGQERLKGKIIRVGTMGYCDASNVIAALSALEMSLRDLGHAIDPGTGVRAAEEVLMATKKHKRHKK